MQTICLMPCRNEADILPITLEIISRYCDHIIIADQMSDDGSREIYHQFPKVKIIDNKRNGHSNEVRWDLLEEARKIEGNNLIICLDADEFIPPALFEKFINNANLKPGQSFRFKWVQLWKSIHQYNNAAIWKYNFKPIAWVDDRLGEYDKEFIINDHTSRIPEIYLKNCQTIKKIPILHLQWVYWNKTQIKQAWYLCSELIKNAKDYKKINATYAAVREANGLNLKNVPSEWLDGSQLPESLTELPPSWQLNAVIDFFNKYGIEFFEPLQIWHIKELKDEFIKRTGRQPSYKKDNPIKIKVRLAKSALINILKMIKYGF